MGFEAPTLVQAQAIPVILSGRHVYPSLSLSLSLLLLLLSNAIIGVCVIVSLTKHCRLVNAATGTGKTVAYLAPIIHHLNAYETRVQRSDGTFGTFLLPLFIGLTHTLILQYACLFSYPFSLLQNKHS